MVSFMVADAWVSLNRAPTERAARNRGRLGTAAVKAHMYVCGGSDGTKPSDAYIGTMEQYDPSTGTMPW